MINVTDKGFLSFLSKNRAAFYVFLVTSLMGANIYQYHERTQIEEKYRLELKRVNEVNLRITMDVVQYERQRSERLEYLLNSLSKTK